MTSYIIYPSYQSFDQITPSFQRSENPFITIHREYKTPHFIVLFFFSSYTEKTRFYLILFYSATLLCSMLFTEHRIKHQRIAFRSSARCIMLYTVYVALFSRLFVFSPILYKLYYERGRVYFLISGIIIAFLYGHITA